MAKFDELVSREITIFFLNPTHNNSIIQKIIHKRNFLFLLPIFGTISFIFLFYIATLYYPGGSQFQISSKGYSWEHNYWCNLLYRNALNGHKNAARPIAIFAMLCLNLSIGGFWFIFPYKVNLELKKRHLIQFTGIFSMLIAIFISSKFHDIIIFSSSFLGLIALLGTLYVLNTLKWRLLLYFGIINFVLVILNFIFYFDSNLISFLPVLQKITFFLFLLWFSCMTYKMYEN